MQTLRDYLVRREELRAPPFMPRDAFNAQFENGYKKTPQAAQQRQAGGGG